MLKKIGCKLEFRNTCDFLFRNKGIAALVVGENLEDLESARDRIYDKYGVKDY